MVPERFRVLGYPLRTYSLGHHLLLHRIRSPFVLGGVPTYDDLALAVLICLNDYNTACLVLQSPLLRFMLRWMEWRASGKFNPLCWFGKKPRIIDLPAECHELSRYFRHGEHVPFHFISQNTVRVPLPMVHAVRVALMQKTTLSEAEIMDRGWQLSLQDYYLIKANDGAIQLGDQDEIEEARKTAEKADELVKAGKLEARE